LNPALDILFQSAESPPSDRKSAGQRGAFSPLLEGGRECFTPFLKGAGGFYFDRKLLLPVCLNNLFGEIHPEGRIPPTPLLTGKAPVKGGQVFTPFVKGGGGILIYQGIILPEALNPPEPPF